jgi:YVTN family beta-propeller protein
MRKRSLQHLFKLSVATAAALLVLSARAEMQGRKVGQDAQDQDDDNKGNNGKDRHEAVQLATGQFITPLLLNDSIQQFLKPALGNLPLLTPYPDFVAGEAVRSQLSPDGTTLAIITAGQNSLYKSDGSLDTPASTQFIFLYDVSGANQSKPVLSQVIQQTNSHVGLVFSPDSKTLYAAGGCDDMVYVYTKGSQGFAPAAQITLGHFLPGTVGNARNGSGLGVGVQPNASGLGVSSDGSTLVVANNYNDSISVIDTTTRTVRYEYDLRPFKSTNEGTPGGVGGTFPFAVAVKGGGTAYVSSDRDREVVVVDISSTTAGRLIKRIKLDGNALGMTMDASQSRLYVAQDNADEVAVINTATNTVVRQIDARAPLGMLPNTKYTGAATFAVTLSPDGTTLYAVNSGANSIAVIPLSGKNANTVNGLIPTAYEPHDITFSTDGSWMYIVNGKSVTGPNPGHLSSNTASLGVPQGAPQLPANVALAAAARASNEYQFQLERASLVSAPVPNAGHLQEVTNQVAKNNGYVTETDKKNAKVMAFLSSHIKHVIYVVKENRTFDQVFGDLNNGSNGDSKLTQFGAGLTPNNHRLVSDFVTLDNFMNPGDGSMDGWSWSLQGRVTNTETITQQINYAFVNRGLSYESEGANRSVPVNWGTVAQRDAAAGTAGTMNYTNATKGLPGGTVNLLTGIGNHASSDAPFGIQDGYIFDAALTAGKSVRNYGFLVNNIGSIGTIANPVSDPFGLGIIQVAPLDQALAPLTDVYFRGYDQAYPDLWRFNEWKREFDQFVANGNLPNLTLFRISHDHMGSFGSALGGINTPELQQADCDLALGKLIDTVAHSPYASSTIIIVIEDDVQDGPDHVDSHRGPALVVGAYVKRHAVVSTRYNQVNVLRTIEDILGTQHLNLNTAFADPMTDVFDTDSSAVWSYDAVASTVLASASMPLVVGGQPIRMAAGPTIKPKHDAAYWDRVTAGFDFTEADQVPPDQFNRVLWKGLMGNKPYPTLHGQSTGDKDDKDKDDRR